ncbi:MAG: cysS [Candidatus Saccharibacteria bacterium]|nr:cysS [Candidatus Saccharibacteria bacterium]
MSWRKNKVELYNSLTKRVDLFEPVDKNKPVRIYSCGPTVYERVHVGNLASFIYADTLRRVLRAYKYSVEHVMNITDIDDKTIRASQQKYPDLEPMEALKKLTREYEELFMNDIKAVGIDTDSITFMRATDNIPLMQDLIRELVEAGFAYITEDGVYFSIQKYEESGRKYGQLVPVSVESTSVSRIDNDEYDKDDAHDFVLWKKQKPGEPAWEFQLRGQDLRGRPGWHIECSAMSTHALGQPFDIHTGGVDLKFPHHENEIAQSTALNGELLANFFFHNEHMHVDEKKMSKSLNNFYTLEDVSDNGFDPLAFRLFVLEGKYSSQRDFTWENLQHSANRLMRWRQVAGRWRRVQTTDWPQASQIHAGESDIISRLGDDLNTPEALERVDSEFTQVETMEVQEEAAERWVDLLHTLNILFGLNISERDELIESLLKTREHARETQDWQAADDIRKQLDDKGIGINDTPDGPVWYRK